MSAVNQLLLADAIADLIKEKQRDGWYGEVSLIIVKGEVQSVSVSQRSKLDDLVRDHVIRKQKVVIRRKGETNRTEPDEPNRTTLNRTEPDETGTEPNQNETSAADAR